MRKLLAAIILCTAVCTIAFAQKGKKKAKTDSKTTSGGYNIKVKVRNTTDTICFLAYHLGDKKYVRDTSLINKKGEFVFSGEEALPGGIYIVYFPNKKNFEIIINEQFFSIETEGEDFVKNFSTQDSEENQVFFDYLKFTGAINEKAIRLSERRKLLADSLNKDDKMKKSLRESFEAEKKEIEETLKGFEKEIKDYREKLFAEKMHLYVVKTFKAVEEVDVPKDLDNTEKFKYYKTHFFDYIDLSDDRMMRTPIVDKKVNRYLEKLTVQDPDSIIKEADYLVGKCKPGSELIKFVIITITNKYSTSKIMCMDRVFVHMVNNYYSTGKAYWADSAQLAKLEDRARTLSWTACGQQTPNLQKLQDTSGNYRELYRQSAKYTVIYFWDPDCGHCKKATPKLVTAYNEALKDMGVRIYAVATTKDKKKWIKFINDKGMREWTNVYDPEYKSPFRQWYDITSTPKVYIVDQRKKVIARQLGVEQISDFIKQHEKIEAEKAKKRAEGSK